MLADTGPVTESVKMRVYVHRRNRSAAGGNTDRNINRNLVKMKSESGQKSRNICVSPVNRRHTYESIIL